MHNPPSVPEAVAVQTRRARWATVLLIVTAVVAVVAFLSSVSQLWLLQSAAAGTPITPAAAAANDARQQGIAGIQLLVRILTAIVFFRWLYRAYGNLRLVGSRATRWPAGWSVGYWFVPFFNLFRPYQAVKELWQRSESGNAMESIGAMRSPVVVALWWFAFLASGLLTQLAMMQMRLARAIEQFVSAARILVGAELIELSAAILTVAVVKGIDQRQRQMGGVAALAGGDIGAA